MKLFPRRNATIPHPALEAAGPPTAEEPMPARWDGYVPASARAPQPVTVAVDEAEGDADADIDFLATLAAQVERQQRKRPMGIEEERRKARLQVQSVTLPEEVQLDVFREMQRHTEHRLRSDALPVPHVELADLIDDLQTTRLALRQRRAA